MGYLVRSKRPHKIPGQVKRLDLIVMPVGYYVSTLVCAQLITQCAPFGMDCVTEDNIRITLYEKDFVHHLIIYAEKEIILLIMA